MKKFNTKIGKIICKEFDQRAENMVFAYLFKNGIENLKNLTASDIDSVKGNQLMTDEFAKSLVKCAALIAQQCSFVEIVEYIRLYLNCVPTVRNLYLYREDYTEDGFKEILNSLDLEDEEVGLELELYVVVDEASLKVEDD